MQAVAALTSLSKYDLILGFGCVTFLVMLNVSWPH